MGAPEPEEPLPQSELLPNMDSPMSPRTRRRLEQGFKQRKALVPMRNWSNEHSRQSENRRTMPDLQSTPYYKLREHSESATCIRVGALIAACENFDRHARYSCDSCYAINPVRIAYSLKYDDSRVPQCEEGYDISMPIRGAVASRLSDTTIRDALMSIVVGKMCGTTPSGRLVLALIENGESYYTYGSTFSSARDHANKYTTTSSTETYKRVFMTVPTPSTVTHCVWVRYH